MKIKPILYVYIGILLFVLFFGIYAATYPNIKTKGLPLVLCGVIFILASIALVKELRTEPQAKEDTPIKTEEAELWSAGDVRGYIIGYIWMAGYILGIYLLGFIPATALFTFAYLKSHKRGWLSSACQSILGTAFIYFLFVVSFHVPLSRGIVWHLLSKL